MSLSVFTSKIPPFKCFRSKEKEENNYIDYLPPEMLVHIFSFYVDSEGHRKFFRNIPLVCKRWNDIYTIPSLWRNVLETEWNYDETIQLGERGLLTSVRRIDYFKFLGISNEMKIKVFETGLLQSRWKLKSSEGFMDGSRIPKLIIHCPNLREIQLICNFASRALMQTMAKYCPNIDSLILTKMMLKFADEQIPEDVISPFLTVRGQELRRLELCNIFLLGNDLVPTIAEHCHSLEQLLFSFIILPEEDSITVPSYFLVRPQLPLNKIMIGCPKIRKMVTFHLDIVSSELGCDKGFNDMVSFNVCFVNFNGIDFYSILRNARSLRHLQIIKCQNIKMSSLSKIPINNLEFLSIMYQDMDDSTFKIIEECVTRCKRTLRYLLFAGLEHDLTPLLKAYLHRNPNPRLTEMMIADNDVDADVFKTLMRTCKNLSSVYWNEKHFRTRKEVEDFCALSTEPRPSNRYFLMVVYFLMFVLTIACSYFVYKMST